MPTLQGGIWAEIVGVGVSQWAAETMGIWQDTGGLTTQRIDNKVREHVWDIAQSMNIINKQGGGPKQYNLLIDHFSTRMSDQASTTLLRNRYITDQTKLYCQKLKAARFGFAVVGLHWREIMLDETPTKKKKLMHDGMNFISPRYLLCALMMCRYRRWRGSNLGSQVLTDKGELRLHDRFPCWVLSLYHFLCGSPHCWEEGGWKQYSAILMAVAWGWWINTSDSYIIRWYNHFANHECCNCRSARPQPENPWALGLLARAQWRWWLFRP